MKKIIVLFLLVNSALSAPTVIRHFSSIASHIQVLSDRQLDPDKDPADLECESCKIIVGILQELMLQNASENEIVDVITRICIDLKIEDNNVCTLVVPEFKVYMFVYQPSSHSRSPSPAQPLRL